MKKSIGIRAFFGLMVVGLGVILLLQNFGIINDNAWELYWGIFWGAAFILAGLSAIASSRTSWLWGVILIAIGASIALNMLKVVDVNFWKIFWPAVLIIVGLGMAFNLKPSRRKHQEKTSRSNEKVAVFYGEEARVNGDYDGGAATAVFGGVELDLRQADIKDGAVIEVFAFCGGITITLPDDVIVNNEVRGILGGSEDKTVPKKGAKKTLHLRGECVLGGLEIK